MFRFAVDHDVVEDVNLASKLAAQLAAVVSHYQSPHAIDAQQARKLTMPSTADRVLSSCDFDTKPSFDARALQRADSQADPY